MFSKYTHCIVSFVILLYQVNAYCQNENNSSLNGLGISFGAGLSKSNHIESNLLPGISIGINSNFLLIDGLFGVVELSYNTRKESFVDLKNYHYTNTGIVGQNIKLTKNYGLLDLKSYVFKEFYQLKRIGLFGFSGVGFNTLFWYGTKIESANFEPISNGATQTTNTNPITRPSVSFGPAIKLPFDKDKTMLIKLEYILDFNLSKKHLSYPNFKSFFFKSSIIF